MVIMGQISPTLTITQYLAFTVYQEEMVTLQLRRWIRRTVCIRGDRARTMPTGIRPGLPPLFALPEPWPEELPAGVVPDRARYRPRHWKLQWSYQLQELLELLVGIKYYEDHIQSKCNCDKRSIYSNIAYACEYACLFLRVILGQLRR